MYNLHLLGWHNFQQLSLTVLREILGQTVESFLDSNDAGRDGAFSGTWRTHGTEDLSGEFVFQCKFSNKSDRPIRVADLTDEFEKAEKLVLQNKCDCYILITNAGISGTMALKLEKLFLAKGVKQFKSYGSDWLIQQIKESTKLRSLVPRLYGLGDLSEILDSRAYKQAATLLETLKDEFAKIVITNTYRQAVEAINKHGFVLLIGEPAAGKTTIASLLAVSALDQWQAETIKVDFPAKLIDHWNPGDHLQFFWIDDAFGATQYESNLAYGWNHILPQVKAMLQKGTKIVMTSRDYIYNRARKDLKTSAFPMFQESQVVIDVHQLTLEEKKQILYNHLKLGKQSKEFKTGIKPYLEDLSQSQRFIPEMARRIADPVFTKNLIIDSYYLNQFINDQESHLQDVLNGLDNHSKATLALIYMRNGALISPITLEQSEEEAVHKLGSYLGKCVAALDEMRGSLVHYIMAEDVGSWKFKHPTIGDAFSAILIKSPELIEINFVGTNVEKLISQVTCGDMGYEKAIVVPKHHFPLIIKRLSEFKKTSSYKTPLLSIWGAKWQLFRFLSYRCSKEFLKMYIDANPEILETITKPGLSLDASEELDLALRLSEFDLLPEQARMAITNVIAAYTIEGQDFIFFEKEEVRNLFSEHELIELQTKINSELIPNFYKVIYKWKNEFDNSYDAEDYIRPLLGGIEALTKSNSENENLQTFFDEEKQKIQDWINEKNEGNEDISGRQKIDSVDDRSEFSKERSIFEDVDD